MNIKLITYPARPVNGGSLDIALPKIGQWFYEPKYNGWRVLVHVPTGTMFNRKGELLTISGEFKSALEKLKTSPFEWLDCEALERRHKIGRGTLIVLDAPIPGGYHVRRLMLERHFETLTIFGNPAEDNVYSVPFWTPELAFSRDGVSVWHVLKGWNKKLGCDFFEGMVAKKADSVYPIQLQSTDREFPFWVKHRWSW